MRAMSERGETFLLDIMSVSHFVRVILSCDLEIGSLGFRKSRLKNIY